MGNETTETGKSEEVFVITCDSGSEDEKQFRQWLKAGGKVVWRNPIPVTVNQKQTAMLLGYLITEPIEREV